MPSRIVTQMQSAPDAHVWPLSTRSVSLRIGSRSTRTLGPLCVSASSAHAGSAALALSARSRRIGKLHALQCRRQVASASPARRRFSLSSVFAGTYPECASWLASAAQGSHSLGAPAYSGHSASNQRAVTPNEPINRPRHGIPALGVISFSPSTGLPRRAGYRRR